MSILYFDAAASEGPRGEHHIPRDTKQRAKSLVIPTRERSETGEPALSEAEGNLLPSGWRNRCAPCKPPQIYPL